MSHSFISIAKKNSPAWYMLVMLFGMPVLLAGCPQQKQQQQKSIITSTAPLLLDSTSLINHLAFFTSPITEGRETATPGNILAQQYIVKTMDSLQLSTIGHSRLQSFPIGEKQGNNVMGFVKGTVYPDSYIVVTAHYDHLGTHNGQVYFGADDNASGSAALLTMAAYFKKHPAKHSILFVAFDAEEKGLVGSNYFTSHPPLPLASMFANINMDMIGRNENNEIYICGTYHYPALKKITDSIPSLPPVKLLLGHDNPGKGRSQDWTTQSDHYAFHKFKIPFLYFGVEDHPDYHRPGDTFDKIQKGFYYRVSNMVAQTVLLTDRQSSLQ